MKKNMKRKTVLVKAGVGAEKTGLILNGASAFATHHPLSAT